MRVAKDKPVKGMFYLRFEDEELDEAIEAHHVGFNTIEDAIGEANVTQGSPFAFKVYDSELKIVFEGVTVPLA